MLKTRSAMLFFVIVLVPWLLLAFAGCSDEPRGLERSKNGLSKPPIVLCCQLDNDLFRVLSDNGIVCTRYDTPEAAIAQAPVNAGVLILADRYPDEPTSIDPSLFEKAAAKRLRLYVEYPETLPGMELGKPQGIQWERTVVSSDFFGPALEGLSI